MAGGSRSGADGEPRGRPCRFNPPLGEAETFRPRRRRWDAEAVRPRVGRAGRRTGSRITRSGEGHPVRAARGPAGASARIGTAGVFPHRVQHSTASPGFRWEQNLRTIPQPGGWPLVGALHRSRSASPPEPGHDANQVRAPASVPPSPLRPAGRERRPPPPPGPPGRNSGAKPNRAGPTAARGRRSQECEG